MPAPLVLSLKQCADRAGVTQAVLRREIREKRLHPLQGLSQVRIARTELARWKRAREAGDRFRIGEIVAQPLVYRLEGRSGSTLYIGVTNNLGARLEGHAKSQPWWSQVTHVSVRYFATRGEAEEAEGAAISIERPKYNKQQPSAGKGARTRLLAENRWVRAVSGEMERERTSAR